MLEVIFTNGKQEYINGLVEKESVYKRKSNRYTLTAIMSLCLFIVFFLSALYGMSFGTKFQSVCVIIAITCLMLMVLFAKLEGKQSALCCVLWREQEELRVFLEAYEKKQIINFGYHHSNADYLVYDYEDGGELKNGSIYIDEYECREDVDKSTLIFGEKIIFRRKYIRNVV